VSLLVDYYTVGSLIAALFNGAVVVFFLRLPEKTRATTWFMLVYLLIGIQNLAYLVAHLFYHPATAYHRWVTVAMVQPGIIAFSQFFFHFPRPRSLRAARLLLGFQLAAAAIATLVFVVGSWGARKFYHFDGHYWDFVMDRTSFWVGLVILGHVITFIAVGAWRATRETGARRRAVIYLALAGMTIAVVPAVVNIFSRAGVIDRGTYQQAWNLMTVLGFFCTIAVFLAVAPNRTSLMTKIVGVCLVTFLLLLQGLSYYSSLDQDRAYDALQRQKLQRLRLDPTYRPDDLRYLVEYGSDGTLTPRRGTLPALRPDLEADLAGTLLRARLEALPAAGFNDQARGILAAVPPALEGHRRVLVEALEAGADRPRLLATLRAADRAIARIRFRVRDLPAAGIRDALDAFLGRAADPVSASFREVLREQLRRSRASGEALRGEVLDRVARMRPAGQRWYRVDTADVHYISFMAVDVQRAVIHEAAFYYADYRRFIHRSAIKLVWILVVAMGILVVGFPVFFSATLERPLAALLQGVHRVNRGDLSVVVPVKVEDEIGYLTRAFNGMVASVRSANRRFDQVNDYLKNVFDSMPSVLVSVDGDLKVRHWNRAAARVTGLRGEDALGRDLGDAFPRLADHLDTIRAAIARRTPQQLEKVARREGEATIFLDIMAYPVVADEEIGAVIRVDEVTARVRLEELMVQTEKLTSVGGLAAGMAHEINNPLGGILMASQNIQRRLSPGLKGNQEAARRLGVDLEKLQAYLADRDVLKMLEGMREMGERATKIVANMLNFSRRSESRLVATELPDLLDRTVDLAANDYDLKKHFDFRHIEIVREYAAETPAVECVPVELQQVVLNLLKNAAQAIAEKPFPAEEHARITLRLGREGTERVRLEVEDNGPGMSAAVQKRVFEPFFTTKEVGVGTGLGLSVSYFIITNNHQGTMTVESEPGARTRFVITLPVTRTTPCPSP
jgi:PAS domain S-box-containing protein